MAIDMDAVWFITGCSTGFGRELAKARWGMPSPLFALQGKRTDPGVTNIRNVKSPHWRRWLHYRMQTIRQWK